MKHQNEYITVKQASEYLGVPLKTVYRLIKNGRIKAVKIGGRIKCFRAGIDRIRDNGTDQLVERAKRHAAGLNERRNQRINSNLTGRFSVDLRPFREVAGIGIIKNLSTEGVYLSCGAEDIKVLDVDDPVDLSFSVGRDEESAKEIVVKGRVVRKEDDGFAVIFRYVDDLIKEMIREYIGC